MNKAIAKAMAERIAEAEQILEEAFVKGFGVADKVNAYRAKYGTLRGQVMTSPPEEEAQLQAWQALTHDERVAKCREIVGDEAVTRALQNIDNGLHNGLHNGLQYKRELLQQIAAGVNQLLRDGSKSPLYAVEVVLVNGAGEEFDFGLPGALDAIANDLTWDERGNWADARIARVQVL